MNKDEKNITKRKSSLIIFGVVIFSFLFLISLVSAEEFGYNYLEGELNVVQAINYTLVSVNDSLLWDGNPWSNTRWLNIDGSNANQDINIGSYDFYANDGFFDYINFSYLISNFGGGIDATGDPWYLSGTDFQIAENLLVDGNITADYFNGINISNLSNIYVQKSGDTMTGPLLHPDGTSAVPSISFSSYPNLGFYRSGTNQFSFTSAGAERFEFGANFIRGAHSYGPVLVNTNPDENTPSFRPTRQDADTGIGNVAYTDLDTLTLIVGGLTALMVRETAGVGYVGIGTLFPSHELNVVGDLNVTGTIFTSALNISNSSFSFMDDENSSISYSIQNINSGTNATSLITTLNDVGGILGIGIGSSNYLLGNVLKPNVTALFSKSKGEMLFANFYSQAFVWMFNPSDDNDPNNLVEIMRLDGTGLNISGNLTSDNVFIPQYIFAHNNATISLLGSSTWTNITFDQENTAIKKGIGHTFDDVSNQSFTFNEDGVYELDYNFDLIDTSGSSTDIDVAGRVIYFNGTEITGSVFETDITKKNIEVELSHDLVANFKDGDVIIFQFVADDADVQISTHGTFGTHPESATVRITKVANL